MAESNFYGVVVPHGDKTQASRTAKDGMDIWLHTRTADVRVSSWSVPRGKNDPADNLLQIRVREHHGYTEYMLYQGLSTALLADPFGELVGFAMKHASPELKRKLFEDLSREVVLANTEGLSPDA